MLTSARRSNISGKWWRRSITHRLRAEPGALRFAHSFVSPVEPADSSTEPAMPPRTTACERDSRGFVRDMSELRDETEAFMAAEGRCASAQNAELSKRTMLVAKPHWPPWMGTAGVHSSGSLARDAALAGTRATLASASGARRAL